MHSILRNKKTILCFLLPALLVYLLSVIVPIIWSGYYSLFDWNGFSGKECVGFANFAKMLGDSELWDSVINTLVYTFFQIVLQVGGGLVLAVLLTKLPFFRRGFQTLYYLPVIVSTVALCQMFKKIFAVTPVGLFNELLSKINPDWIRLEWLSNPDTSLGMVIFTSGYKNMPIYMLIFFSALLTVPHSLEEAARIDGANSWQIFWRINLPHIRPPSWRTFYWCSTVPCVSSIFPSCSPPEGRCNHLKPKRFICINKRLPVCSMDTVVQ